MLKKIQLLSLLFCAAAGSQAMAGKEVIIDASLEIIAERNFDGAAASFKVKADGTDSEPVKLNITGNAEANLTITSTNGVLLEKGKTLADAQKADYRLSVTLERGQTEVIETSDIASKPYNKTLTQDHTEITITAAVSDAEKAKALPAGTYTDTLTLTLESKI